MIKPFVIDESLSKQQKEFFLRQQLAAIQRELHVLQRSNSSSNLNGGLPLGLSSPNGPPSSEAGSAVPSELDDDEHEADDMADLKRKIEAMEPGSEERKMWVREWRRLKRIPAGSVENGVIRSYLEWLTSVRWPNSSAIAPNDKTASSSTSLRDKSFLTAARTQLDADHFGLEKIKKRLIEFLAVVRLKELNAEKEAAEAAAIAQSEAVEGSPKTDGNVNANDSVESKDVVVFDKEAAAQAS